MYNEYFTIPYVIDTIPNSTAVHQLPTQAKKKFCIIAIDGEDPITTQGAIYGIKFHQTPRVKYKVEISLCRRKSYQMTDIEEVRSRFDQVRPVVSHIEVLIPEKTITPKNIGEALKGPRRPLWKDDLFVQYDKNKNVNLLLAPIPIK